MNSKQFKAFVEFVNRTAGGISNAELVGGEVFFRFNSRNWVIRRNGTIESF